MHRPAQRLIRILACAAAVPVILAASGCSSDSGSGDDGAKESGAKASASAGDAAASVKAAAFDSLPEPCEVLTKKTLDELVPKREDKSGKEGKSDDTSLRGTCSWTSLDNNGVKGSQFRWLNVSLLRFESDAARGSGDKLAQAYFDKQVKEAQGTQDAKNVKSAPVQGVGDEATAVRYDLKKKEGSFKQQTVVARVENVVVTLDYDGAGLAGEKTPSATELMKDAQKAAKQAVEAVVAANGTSSAKPGDGSSDKATSGTSKESATPEASKSSS
ncbi:DUF3558 family protein [Streptomyces sp. PSKA54]|uniref:DUF3558 family protein n=1 Tax=Streptomyces himalayensis subsp. aureolus TaxID=2758039 RepID=A0A7W2D491_9ACTN|nr:DUF3558 family protein [Streptomyces himalayensis]MBA4864484.1 DUF3558 family protein [Streptomyces himalayensis subsp. aureolus]